MPQVSTQPIPAKDEALVGDDGELLEADPEVDLAKYAEYVANFDQLPRQHLLEWDQARLVEWGAMGCILIFIIVALLDILIIIPYMLH